MRIRLDVTKDDILSGERYSPRKCPVARALTSHRKNVYVTESSITVGRKVVDTPLELRDFIIDFDMGRYVRPGTFWLTVE
jgi:hypothetical protein